MCRDVDNANVANLFVLLAATSDVKENKDNDKKGDSLKEPPLESDVLVRVSFSSVIKTTRCSLFYLFSCLY